ncbi:diguanylate cyclase [Thermohalobacter berrensis]|uniref:Diguanylate cyclase n=1 Tax=Thermohalobacter berrensis TaxID=99594 RepID=A0A419T1K3_9FIRM|nr:diguanylate cyclase [Thermohalobacter berrensis]RKD31450.1 hypothetical protein BET03_12595 [Thermohalobacter berrensis]
MDLINDRYKVEKVYQEEANGTIYEVIDLLRSNRKRLLKIIDENQYSEKIIKYFTGKFLHLTSIRHTNVLSNHSFNLIKTIDNKKTNIKRFFYTKEYVPKVTLKDLLSKLNLKEVLNIIVQICNTIDDLHFHGFVYKYLNPENIYIVNEKGKLKVKLKDLAAIKEQEYTDTVDNYNRIFISPEIKLNDNKVDIRSDIYSIGMILDKLVNNKKFDISDFSNKAVEKGLKKIINKMTKLNPNNRYQDVTEVINDLNNLFKTNYKLDKKKNRERLILKTCLIGRDKEVNEILEIDKKFEDRQYSDKMIMITGESGIGKTRFLKEIAFKLKIKDRNVYNISVSQKSNDKLEPIKDLLRKMIKDCSSNLIKKYGCELVKIIPEIGINHNIKPSTRLSGNRELLRLYDRIANFIFDYAKYRLTYIIIDDFHNSDVYTVELLNYIVRHNKNIPLLLIISYNQNIVNERKEIKEYLLKMKNLNGVKRINLLKLNLDETAQLVKDILGINYKPINFSTRLLEQTRGNPRFIEEVIKNLYGLRHLYINDDGLWDYTSESYSKMYIPSDIEEALKNQIDLLDKELYRIIKIISLFNSPVSKDMLEKLISIDKNKLDKQIDKLVGMKILDERVEDWGYTYDYNNINLKKHVKSNISNHKKVKMHKVISDVLEQLYKDNKLNNIDELVYHLNKSNQKDKAIKYSIDFAKKMDKIITNTQSILFWEKAYKLFDEKQDIRKLEVLLNMGRLYQKEGANDKAIDIYVNLLDCAKKLDKPQILVKGKIKLAEIYIKRNNIQKANKYIKNALKLADSINDIDGYLNAAVVSNRINIELKNYKHLINDIEKYLKLAYNTEKINFIPQFYNQLGIISMRFNKVKKAIKYFEKSAEYFKKMENYSEAAKPINNLSVLYFQLFNDFDKSIKYLKEGLSIAREHHSRPHEAVFLNNLAVVYINQDEYEEAEKQLSKALNIAEEIGDKGLIIQANINYGNLYLNTGRYEKCYNQYKKLKDEFNESTFYNQNTSEYYSFLCKFYFKFGQWDKAIYYCKKIIQESTKFENKERLLAESILILIKYYKDGIIDLNNVNKLRQKYSESLLFRDRRDFLLNLVYIFILEDDYKNAMNLLVEDKDVSKKFSSEYMDFLHKILYLFINENNTDKLLESSNKLKYYKYPELKFLSYGLIGRRYFEKGEYYKAANYYLEVLDKLYRSIKNIPNRQMQIGLVKSYSKDKIKERINVIKDILIEDKKENIKSDDLKYTEIEDFFDINTVSKLFNNKEIYTEALKHYNFNNKINNINELISNFADDYKENLNLILQFGVSQTLAKRGFIVIYKEGTDNLEIVTQTNEICNISKIRDVIAKVRQTKKGVLINNRYNKSPNNQKLILPNDAVSLICIPIFKLKNKLEPEIQDRRKKKNTFDNNEIIGYIYLDSDRIFNRFDNKRYNLVKVLANLIFLNIENYNLKTISSIDKLTGTYTRKYFDKTFNDLLNKAKKTKVPFSVIIIDIDKFKSVNDKYGHQKGDEILSKVGNIILNCTRSTDIVARYGGEEFVIISMNTNKDEAFIVAEKIRKEIEESKLLGDERSLTVSLGIANFPEDSQYKEELIEKADKSLYYAKKLGRNQTVFWNEKIKNTSKRFDKLAGIVSGNTPKDQRNVLTVIEIVNLIREKLYREDKIYLILGRLIEFFGAYEAILMTLDENERMKEMYSRRRFLEGWIQNPRYNEKIINEVIINKVGKYLIDWEDIRNIDPITGKPDWQSLIVVPLIFNGKLKGILQISVPIKEKEFDYNSFNFANTVANIIATII